MLVLDIETVKTADKGLIEYKTAGKTPHQLHSSEYR